MFDYAIHPSPTQEGIDIILEPAADSGTVNWFPHLRRGMERGWMELQTHHKRFLTGIQVTVEKIHTHPIDTTPAGCEYYGFTFIGDVAEQRAVRCS
jgi:hypothetical protein